MLIDDETHERIGWPLLLVLVKLNIITWEKRFMMEIIYMNPHHHGWPHLKPQ